jgi:hypothetical protein
MSVENAFLHDAELPGLVTAMNPAAAGPLLAEHLWPGEDVPVAACRVARIRYRRHVRCFLQYELKVSHPSLREARTYWVTGALYRDTSRTRHLARKSARLAPPRTDTRDPLPVCLIADTQMLVSVFPFDRKLPQAPVLVSGRDPVLQHVVRRSFGEGTWTLEDWRVTPVRYREHLSLVVRVDAVAREATTGARTLHTFYVKTYPEVDQARRAFERLSRLGHYAARVDIGVRVDPPLACLDHLGAVVFRSACGRPLDEIVNDGDDATLIQALGEAARALARFNQSDAPTDRRYTGAEYRASVERAATLLEHACPELENELRAVLAAFSAERLQHDVRPTHRDMKPEHVLLGGDRPQLIDLDSCAAADPVLDVALMLARFAALRSASAHAQWAGDGAALFAAEYFGRVPASWRARLPCYYGCALVEVAAGIFHRQEHDWRRRVALLVREAARCER